MDVEVKEERRLFVGGLSDRITEDDLKKTFSRFGSVQDVAIKRKHSSSAPGGVELFSFVNMNCIQSELGRCFSLLNNTKWKGSRIVVQLAKESYMERLKRERESLVKVAPADGKEESLKLPTTNVPIKIVTPTKLPAIKTPTPIKPAVSKLVVTPVTKPTSVKVKFNDTKVEVKPEPVDVKKPKKEVIVKEEPLLTEPKNIMSMYSSKKKAYSEMKRVQSQHALVKLHQDRLQAISKSLSNPDATVNKKIKFDVDEDQGDETPVSVAKSDPRVKSLFEGSSDEDEDEVEMDVDTKRFKDKSQFQGKKGEKLFKLQSSYNNDSRFTLDEKFASDSESGNEEEESNDDGNLEKESKKNLGILEDVLGHQVSNHDEAVGLHSISKKNLFKDFGFLRYDPKKADAEKFIVKPKLEDEISGNKKRKNQNDPNTDEQTPEVDLTDTSRFYDVSEDLTKALASTKSEGGQFKLLQDSEPDDSDEIEEKPSRQELEITRNVIEEPPSEPLDWRLEADNYETPQTDDFFEIKTEPSKETEFFFFQKDDERLREGVDFFFHTKFYCGPNDDWPTKRKSLLRYMAARRKYALKRQSSSIQIQIKQKRRQSQFNRKNLQNTRNNK